MNESKQSGQTSSTTAFLIIAGLLLLGFVTSYIFFVLIIGMTMRPQPTQAAATIVVPSPTQEASATLPPIATSTPTAVFTPTSSCNALTLTINSTAFQIQALQPASDGSVTIPTDSHNIAYWVTGTDSNYLFVLSPAPDHAALASTLTEGSTAKATLANCNSKTYSLSVPEQGSFNISTLINQAIAGITIFLQTDSSGVGFVVRGELTEEQINVFDTPAPGALGPQAEISLLGTTTSADMTIIRIGITLQNVGESAFTISVSDVALTPQDTLPLTLITSEPALPKEVKPGVTETIYFTFPRPGSQTAVLKILGVEYEINGY